MASALRPLVAGNWKMNGLKGSAAELTEIIEGSGDLITRTDLMVCPPATLVLAFAALARGSQVAIGGQDCHAEASGAFTGDISAEMLKDAGASAVIVGHSERRADHHETNADVAAKARAAWRAQLTAIVCIGETKDERAGGRTLDIVGSQLQGSLPDGADAANTGHRLRAGLGDRHRPDADARRCRRSAWLHPATTHRPLSVPQGRACASSMAAR